MQLNGDVRRVTSKVFDCPEPRETRDEANEADNASCSAAFSIGKILFPHQSDQDKDAITLSPWTSSICVTAFARLLGVVVMASWPIYLVQWLWGLTSASRKSLPPLPSTCIDPIIPRSNGEVQVARGIGHLRGMRNPSHLGGRGTNARYSRCNGRVDESFDNSKDITKTT